MGGVAGQSEREPELGLTPYQKVRGRLWPIFMLALNRSKRTNLDTLCVPARAQTGGKMSGKQGKCIVTAETIKHCQATITFCHSSFAKSR